MSVARRAGAMLESLPLAALEPARLGRLRWRFSDAAGLRTGTDLIPLCRSELRRIAHEYRILFEPVTGGIRPVVALTGPAPPMADPSEATPRSEVPDALYLPLARRLHPFVTDEVTGQDCVLLDPACIGVDEPYAFFEDGAESRALSQVRGELRAAWHGRQLLAEAAQQLQRAGLLEPLNEALPFARPADMKTPLFTVSSERARSEFEKNLAGWMDGSALAVELALVAEFSEASGSRIEHAQLHAVSTDDVDALLVSPGTSGWLDEDDTLRF